jgi:hypothetical protein
MRSPFEIAIFRAFVVLVTAALGFGIAPRVHLALSFSIARSKAHIPQQVASAQFQRPTTCVFADGHSVDIGQAMSALSSFVAFVSAAVPIAAFWYAVSRLAPQFYRDSFRRTERKNDA